jgi:hypothetical protein
MKLTPQKLTQFLVTYYTGGYPHLKLGQAFTNQYTTVDSLQNLSEIHTIKDDVEALKVIVAKYLR